MKMEKLKDYGIDYESGLRRFGDDKALYEKVLGIFLEYDKLTEAKAAFSREDYPALREVTHSLKGSAGNLDMVELYRASGALNKLLLAEEFNAAELNAAFAAMEAAYVKAEEGIRVSLER